jgi:hypothetical protein
MRTPDFLVEASARYILYLEVQPGQIDFQRQECLLDMEQFDPRKCDKIPSVIALSWTLWNGLTAMADNNSQRSWKAESSGNGFTRREIGRFDAQGGRRYALSVDFRSDPSELNAANPRIVAEAIQDWDGFALETQLSFAFGVLLVFIGVVLLFA